MVFPFKNDKLNAIGVSFRYNPENNILSDVLFISDFTKSSVFDEHE